MSWPHRLGWNTERVRRNVHFATIRAVGAMSLSGGVARAPPSGGMQMLTFDRRILVAATLAVLLLGSIGIAVPAEAARDLPIQLYGSRSTGWGLTNTSLSVPGPSLAVEVGDNVTLNLTSFDGNRHNWYIDYNSNSAVDANETSSSSPSTRGNVVWNFTVSNRTGTFVYRSRIAGDGNMWGNITISTAGGLGTILGNPLVVIGMVVVFGAILAIAVWAYRRPRHPPEPPQSQ